VSCRTRIAYHDWYARRGFATVRASTSRYRLALDTLADSPLKTLIPLVESPAATENDLLRVHDVAFVDSVQRMDLEGAGRLDGSTPVWHGLYERAERVVGGSLLGADLIAAGYADHVFNPAGGQHHAHRDRAGGFCVFNDVVAAVRRFQDHGFERIAVVDVDGHHGDGTESLLWSESVLTVSLHQFGERTYPGTGPLEAIGQGQGLGFALNLPLARGVGDEAYQAALVETVEPVLRAYRPQVVILEFGTDGHAADPLLKLCLSTRLYRWIAHWIHSIAHEFCEDRLLVVGGGGYEPEHVVRCWMLMLAELAGVAAQDAHRDAVHWLHEPVPLPNPESELLALATSRDARVSVFPLHGLVP
jgi:acetoin utilization protein AcuC